MAGRINTDRLGYEDPSGPKESKEKMKKDVRGLCYCCADII
jgi:hypothetical protein